MKITYGKTFWGEAWLNALTNIDYENRLERGRRYANNESVRKIAIVDNAIKAKVIGSAPSPYTVTIISRPFTLEEKEIFINELKQNKHLIPQLLNRQLPKEIMDIALKHNINLFPKSWQDLKLNCSCPDWAVPCKHLAAVIYKVANEIDQNPFIAFSLHNLDLIEELKALNIHVDNLSEEKIYAISDSFISASKKGKNKDEKIIPDFSIIEEVLQKIPLLYSSNPLFYETDFKKVIQNSYASVAKHEANYLLALKSNQPKLLDECRYFDWTINCNTNGDAVIYFTNSAEKKQIVDIIDFLTLLSLSESKKLDLYSSTFAYLYRVFRFSNFIVEKGGVIPRLLDAGSNNYKIQWIPALINDSIHKVFNDLLTYHEHSVIVNETKKGKKENINYFSATDGQLLICSLFINFSIAVNHKNYYNSNGKTSKEKIEYLFFKNELVEFKTLLEKQIPNTIQLWLNRFFIADKKYAPIIKIEEASENEKESHFIMDIVIRDKNNSFENIISYEHMIASDDSNTYAVLKDLQVISEFIPELSHFIKSKGKTKIPFNNAQFVQVLEQVIPVIKMLGIGLLLPKSLQFLAKPKASVILTANNNKQFLKLNELVSFDWQISMGNTFITPEEFLKTYQASTQLVKIKEQFVLLKKDDVEKILEQIKKPFQSNPISLLHAAISGDYEGAPITIDAKLKKELEKLFGEKNVPLPKKLKATLRPYQERGYSWLYKNAKLGLGSILADDMGLGKTLQSIAALLKFKHEGFLKDSPALVIAPTTLLSNWNNEIEKFAPTLSAMIYHGTNRNKNFKGKDVVITTYGIARSDNYFLAKQKWFTIIIDEAQNIKNTGTAQTRAVKNIPSSTKIALSGTPVENRLSEYWSIFDYCNNGYLGTAEWFNNTYGAPIELNYDKERLSKFLKITSPFILRRLKSDKTVISDLPEKIENNQYTTLTKEQAALYNSLTTDLLLMVQEAKGINRKGLILKLLTVLKQVCNHPNQYSKVSTHNPQHSGKVMLLLQLLENIYETGEKVIIFSQYKEMGDILNKIISEVFNKKVLQLHGGTARQERDIMVKSFQTRAFYDTFILSLKAGGTGLNLTAANHVIHFDLWWNPALEAQATDRAFRIGQKKNVMVHRLITKGTLEEKIETMLNSKKELSRLTVKSGEKWIGDLSNADLKDLVSLV